MTTVNRSSFVLVIVFTAFAITNESTAQGVRERERVSYTGTLISNIISYRNGSPMLGDVLAVSVEANRGEEIMVQLHMYAVPSNQSEMENPTPPERMPPVTPSSSDFTSRTMRGVATTSTTFHAMESTDYGVAVFFPFGATSFDRPGEYAIRYRLRIWVGSRVVDDYYLSQGYIADVPTRSIRRTYRLAAGQGPNSFDFSLLGADEP